MTDLLTSPQATAHAPARQHYQRTLAILVFSSMAYGLQQTLVAPALPAIQEDLGVSTTAVTYLLTAFLLSASVFTPIIGRLGDMFGKKRMLVLTLMLFAVGSLVAALSHDIGLLITGRVIQGASGAIFPLAFGIVRDEFPREKVASGIGLVSAMIGIGGAAGVVFSGIIVDNLTYEWVFWIGLIFTSLTVVLTWLFVPESPNKSPSRIDWVGAALLSGGMIALLIGVSEGNDWGWLDNRVIGLFAVAGWLLVFWVAYEQRHPEPLVDMKMMSYRPVFTTNLAAVLIGFGMYSSFIVYPKFVQTPSSAGYGFGSSVTQAGLFLLPNACAMLIAGPTTGPLSKRFGSRFVLMLGTVLTLVAFLLLAIWHGTKGDVYASSFISGLGIGYAFSAMPNLIIEAVEPSQTGVATGMNAIMRTVGGAIGGQIAAAILTGYTLAGHDDPREIGYTLTFALLAVALGVALLSVFAIPNARRSAAADVPVIAEPDPALLFAPELVTPAVAVPPAAPPVASAAPPRIPPPPRIPSPPMVVAALSGAGGSEAPRRSSNLTLIALTIAAISYALQQTLIAPALPEIEAELHSSTTTATYTLTAFLLAGSVSTPIFGRFGDMFGKKKMLVVTLGIFGIGSLICALSNSMGMLIAGRSVQGFASAIFPLAYGIVRDEFPREKVASSVGILSSTFGIGGGAGIVLSGVIVDHLSYEWIFWLGLVVIAIAGVTVGLVVPESPIRAKARIDWVGAFLLSAGLTAGLLGVSEGNAWGWTDARILALFAACAAILTGWVFFETKTPDPLVAMGMMARRPVFAVNLASVLLGFGMFASFILVPQYVQADKPVGFAASVTQSGLYMLPSSLIMLVSAPIAGWMCGRFGAKLPLLMGAVLSALGFAFLAVEHSHKISIYFAMGLLGVGIGTALSAMANAIIENVDPTETGVATGMNTIMRTVGGAVGGQLSAAVLTAHLAANGAPTDSGFTAAFAVIAVSLVGSVICVLFLPGRKPRAAKVSPDAAVTVADEVPLGLGAEAAVPVAVVEPALGTLVSGRVRRGGAPVAAVLTVIGPGGRQVLNSRADERGEFAVSLRPGRYYVVATDAGRDPRAVAVDVNGRPVQVDLALPGVSAPPAGGIPATSPAAEDLAPRP